MDKDMKKLVKALEKQGFTCSLTTKGHVAVYRGGVLVATFSGTASDWRSMKNALAPLRRAGFEWPPKR
ncbi:hypothetical protein HJ590_13065 [Naumannella sp. ID2617S]|nr:hypothetical protein [Enemella dayhoffiae]NNG20478.1 hypothetical protein [Naumannella sp. ID2617S]